MKVDLRVIKEPVTVDFICPHCEEETEMDFNDFCNEIGEVCDWQYTKFECPECSKTIEIDGTEWI